MNPLQTTNILSSEVEDRIQAILDHFDFGLVHRALIALDLSSDGASPPPSMDELRKLAQELLRDIARLGQGILSRCGMEAVRTEADELGLRFVLTEVWEESDEGEGQGDPLPPMSEMMGRRAEA